jgi:tetratricopeptide (TPR) repeat protein
MVQICPACNAENRDIAKFCDQCASALTPDAVPFAPVAPAAVSAATVSPARQAAPVNWTALLFFVAIVLAVVWVIRMPASKDQAQLGLGSGGGAAAGGDPMGTMADVQKQLDDLKARLKKDPLDVEALTGMYDMYGQIGQAEKVRPSLDAALAEWRKRHDPPTSATEEDRKQLAGLALAALQGMDERGAITVLELYHESEPDNLGVIATLGNLHYDLQEAAPAVEWYDKYLARATVEEQGEDIARVRTDKATMLLHLAGNDSKSVHLAGAVTELTWVNTHFPAFWAGWYNLGEARTLAGDKPAAIIAYKKAMDVATDDSHRWQAEKEIAVLEGKDPPPPPTTTAGGTANPHGEMSNPHGEMANPHSEMGELPKPAPGTPNPHGEGF